MDHECDVLGGYIPSFVQHLKDTGARLGLQIGSQENEVQINSGGTEAHALSTWTPAEHIAFFRALSVHSRWRPDLIVACVPTRAKWEVWMYLEALEEGAATLAMRQVGEDVNMVGSLGDEPWNLGMQVDGSSSDSHSHSDSDPDEGENACEPAHEVSQAWIDVEERMASWIVHKEQLTSGESDAAADTDNVDDEPPKRKRGRPRGAGKGRAQGRVRGQMVSSEGRLSPPLVHRSPSPEHTSTSACKREALMGRLEVPHLLVLDSILRESEEAMKEKSKSREGSATATILTEHGDDIEPRIRDAQVSSLSHRITAPSNASESPSNMVIDPVLLALSEAADPARRQTSRVTSEGTSTSCAPARWQVPTPGPSLFPDASQSGTFNMPVFQLGNATLANPDPMANVESGLPPFSPRSRRRIQKRLYMRRKRALLRENGATSEHTGLERLKPGKKAKLGKSETSTVPTPVPCSEALSDAEMKSSENVVKKNKPGLTLPYKLKAQFAELGVDAAYLHGKGMDLLNMSALGKLMGLYSSLEHGEEESTIAQSIDAQLIRHLQAGMVAFVTDIIYRAIVWKEREIRLKRRSRAWRHGDQITVCAVEHAVEAVGARYHSHKQYFKSLGALHGLSTEPSANDPANASEKPDFSGADDPNIGEMDQPPGLSRHRDVYTPLIQPPSAWRMAPLTCLSRTYEREATRTRRGASAESEEGLMSNETDEEALEVELEEEEEADLQDMALGATHEEDLWKTID